MPNGNKFGCCEKEKKIVYGNYITPHDRKNVGNVISA